MATGWLGREMLRLADGPPKCPAPLAPPSASPVRRRRVDWRVTLGDAPPQARLVSPSVETTGLARITSLLTTAPSGAAVDQALREAVEFARTGLHLERTAIFLLDPDEPTLLGTWGTDAQGDTIDEHDIAFALDALTNETFARAEQGYPWSVYEGCPHVSHEEGQTRILGWGWLACTAILGDDGPLGILFNDTALGHGPVDEEKQARTALLCSLLGRALQPCRRFLFHASETWSAPGQALVRQASQLLARDPSMSFRALAKHLRVSTGHLTRTFKRHHRTSIVGYRNELRLARFLAWVDEKPDALLAAALGAGFGSYAQFHRIFCARFGKGPRQYLLESRQQKTTKRNHG
jgi:AraC-like DNA-binding protein